MDCAYSWYLVLVLLRPYQTACLDLIRAHIKNGARSVLWQLPTGAGKTIGAAFMLKRAMERGWRAWFVVHRRELIKQAHCAFLAADVQHGIIASGFDGNGQMPVQIVSVQTVIRRLSQVRPPDLLVLDEAHHCPAGSWRKIVGEYPQAVRVGLSATPQRLDGKGLSDYFEQLVVGPTVRELIEAGYLSRYRFFAPSAPVLSGVHMRAGDYAQDELDEVMNRPQIVGDAIEHYRKLAMGRRALVFAVSLEASRRIVDGFVAAGIPAEHVDGETDSALRDAAMQRLRAGETKVLSNVDLFGEGVDVPALEAVILLRPTQSLALYLQQVGRGLRMTPGKRDCVILDHAGNCRTHGLPDEDREWSLEGFAGKSRAGDSEGVSPIRQCKACFAVSPITATVCVECGTPFPVTSREVAEVDGTLEEIDQELIRKHARREQGRANSLEALIALGRQRGYKPGWAHFVWNSRRGRRREA
jgi:superfamily II DNA or RNA helicase